MRPITQEELSQAFKDTPINKSPRPDGFKTDLFDHCRDMIREEVWEIIEDSRSSRKVLWALNATFLTLIPKEEKVTHLKQFR